MENLEVDKTKIIDGLTYQDFIDSNWSNEQLFQHPKYKDFFILKKKAPPPPPSTSSNINPSTINSEESDIDSILDNNEISVDFIDNINIDELSTIVETEINSPLTINTFEPIGEKIIAKVSPANFDGLLKIIDTIAKENTENISIRGSKIKHSTSNYIIQADITKILSHQGKTIDLDIINPKKYKALFSQFRNSNDVFIIDDPQNSRFIITNGEIRLFLPKQDEVSGQEVATVDFTGASIITKKEVDKESRKIIRNLAKDQAYIEYLLQDGKLKAMHIPNIAIFKFSEFINDEKSKKLDETNAELILRSSNFLPIDAESYEISLIKLKDDNYASITTCQASNQINVMITETLDNTTNGGLVF